MFVFVEFAVLIEWIIIAVIVIFFLTQIVFPILTGQPLFGLFRKNLKAKDELDDEQKSLGTDLELAILEQQKKALEKQIADIKEKASEGKLRGRKSTTK